MFEQPSPAKQATPLPTPSPKDHGAQEQDWTVDQSSSSDLAEDEQQKQKSFPQREPSNSRPASSTTAVSSASACASPPPPEGGPGQAASNPRKQVGGARRAGSFARGFLLGLSGGGTERRSRSPVKASSLVTGKGRIAPVVASTTSSGQQGDQGDKEDANVSRPVVVSRGDVVVGVGASGRDRWVKGAPPSPSNSSEGEVDGPAVDHRPPSPLWNRSTERDTRDCCIDPNSNLGVDNNNNNNSNQGACSVGGRVGGNVGGENDVAANPEVAATPRDGEALIESMAWLETGTASGNGVANAKAAGQCQSKKKKKKGKTKTKGGKSRKLSGATKAAAPLRPSSEPNASKAEPTAAKTEFRRENKQERRHLNVTFGRVNLLEFTRDVGGCGVPSDGTWGLALGLPFRETMVDVDGYEASKAQVLYCTTLPSPTVQ